MHGRPCVGNSFNVNHMLESLCMARPCAGKSRKVQSGASSRAKHGGAYFSAVRGSMKDPIAVPGRDEVQEC